MKGKLVSWTGLSHNGLFPSDYPLPHHGILIPDYPGLLITRDHHGVMIASKVPTGNITRSMKSSGDIEVDDTVVNAALAYLTAQSDLEKFNDLFCRSVSGRHPRTRG